MAAAIKANDFLERLKRLFSDVESWAAAHGMTVQRVPIALDEEGIGSYSADKLGLFLDDGSMLAELLPVGAAIIGANGRVDMVGTLERVTLVDLEAGGPTMTTTIRAGGHEETRTTAIYRGVTEAGWYWVESRKLGRARRLDEALFLDLLAEVSGHEFT